MLLVGSVRHQSILSFCPARLVLGPDILRTVYLIAD